MPRLMALALLTLLLTGCGQTGPLYLPDDQRAAERYDPQGEVTPSPAPGDETSDQES